MSRAKGRSSKTSFDVELEGQMRSRAFARAFKEARADIESVDAATNAFLRGLDQARIRRGLSKAELARRIGASPAVMRRLLSIAGQNPTLTTLMKIAAVLGMELQLKDAESRAYRKAG